MTPLFVVATIILFLSLEWVVGRVRQRKAQAAPALQPAGQPYPLRIPEGVFFAKSHTWLNLFPSGQVRLGIDDFVGRLLEKPEVTLMKRAGESVERGDPILILKEGDHRLTIRSPLAGDILAVNGDLADDPDLMREVLFSKGWAYTLRPRRPEELRTFMLGDESRAWMKAEFRRLRDLFAGAGLNGALVPVMLQDGGPPVAGALKHLDSEGWRRFEEEFLQEN